MYFSLSLSPKFPPSVSLSLVFSIFSSICLSVFLSLSLSLSVCLKLSDYTLSPFSFLSLPSLTLSFSLFRWVLFFLSSFPPFLSNSFCLILLFCLPSLTLSLSFAGCCFFSLLSLLICLILSVLSLSPPSLSRTDYTRVNKDLF